MAYVGSDPTAIELARAWAAAYRDPARKAERFPCDPDAEFFPRDMDFIAAKIESDAKVIAALREALKPFTLIGWMTSDTEHTGRTIVAHMHPESNHEIILSSDDFRRAKAAYEQTAGKSK